MTRQSPAVNAKAAVDGAIEREVNDDIALIIPAYNEVRTIRDLVVRSLAIIRLVIVVDDGSNDGTAAALEGLPITLLRHDTNQGKASSLWDGFIEARKRMVVGIVTIDGDGQHLPEDIPRLLRHFRAAPDTIIIGSRLHEKDKIPRSRYNANRFANFWVAWAAGYPIIDSQSGFRVYPATLLDRIKVAHRRSSCFVFESEILIEAGRIGVTSCPVPIAAIYMPDARASHFRPILDIARIVRMIAWKLVSRGMYPQGLVRSLRKP
ncbi:MAG TPA: glycosyltransferase family 2 protein [Burkholderiaceae bacterium]